nr:hypothetical protein CFP56_04056 [Quercus suber]
MSVQWTTREYVGRALPRSWAAAAWLVGMCKGSSRIPTPPRRLPAAMPRPDRGPSGCPTHRPQPGGPLRIAVHARASPIFGPRAMSTSETRFARKADLMLSDEGSQRAPASRAYSTPRTYHGQWSLVGTGKFDTGLPLLDTPWQQSCGRHVWRIERGRRMPVVGKPF